jgi:signal transduction histidine kinase
MDKAIDLLDLKKRLLEEIQKNNSDNSLILTLSHEIAKLDETQVRFSVDAGIINRLGKELVGKHETAVSELVKNAYDADSTEVELIFENAKTQGGKLFILDNGVGMTRDQLINGFMRLSSSEKIHNPRSPNFDRIRAGRKGIGRFATQRLGDILTIITQTKESTTALKVCIDWDKFETDKDLSIISNSLEFIPKKKEEGTDLKEHEKSRTDPGFRSSYFRKDDGLITKIIDEDEAFLKHALAEIEGYVMNDGQGCWSLKSEKLGFKEEIFLIGKERNVEDSKFEQILDVHFKCFYFIYEHSLLPSQIMSFIKEVAENRGGVRLYRNGIRVTSFGEKFNDWLGLDAIARSRGFIAPVGNKHVFGFVEVTDLDGLLFEETSSREDLIINKAYEELVDFVQRSILSALVKVAELRGRKARAGQKGWVKETPSEKVDTAILKIKKAFEETEKEPEEKFIISTTPKPNKEEFEEAFQELIEGREEEKMEKQKLIDENNMLRILAGLGLVIGEFVHEVKRFLPAFDTDTRFLRNALKEFSDAQKRLLRLETNIKSFTTYTSYFDRAIARNVFRELVPIELRDVVNDFKKVVKNDLDRTGIILPEPIFEGIDLFTIPMHPSEWASILFNFYTNSKKAIKRKGVPGKLMIKCGQENGMVFLEFSDNGDGIPKQNEELIFDAFFTTSSAAGHSATDSEAITGTGLGLKIVKDIVESYGGSIQVVNPINGYSTSIKLFIPANKSR